MLDQEAEVELGELLTRRSLVMEVVGEVEQTW